VTNQMKGGVTILVQVQRHWV